jgi:succinate dehydrogenase / fumarate reductase membrane anchor subunit
MNLNITESGQAKSKTATFHWLWQRFTAVALVPLTIQFLIFLKLCLTADFALIVSWLQSPFNYLGLSGWLSLTCLHAALGIQVVLEDYVGDLTLQKLLIKCSYVFFILVALISILFLFRIIA